MTSMSGERAQLAPPPRQWHTGPACFREGSLKQASAEAGAEKRGRTVDARRC